MNHLHHWLCRSARWRETIRQRMPWTLGGADLGPNVLELGPGPGLTTDLLRLRVEHVTAVELDPSLARSLSSRLCDSNVDVVAGDATAMAFSDRCFSGVVSFTMLHHVPSPELQDRLLREVWRVIRPGGSFVGSDSLQGWLMRLIHIGDTLVPVDPDRFGGRLEAAGFEVVAIEKHSQAFRFHARRPEAQSLKGSKSYRALTAGGVVREIFDLRRNPMKKLDVFVRKAGWLTNILFLMVVGVWFGSTAQSAVAADEPEACSATSESRQLDFWLGDWTVTNSNGSGSASSSHVSLALDKCLFVENWNGGKGHSGETLLAYSPEDRSWYGMFADNEGRVHVFVDGKVASGSAEFHGSSRGPDGEAVLNRVKVVRVTPNKLEQTWEKSTDNGVTWKTVFSGQYSRKE